MTLTGLAVGVVQMTATADREANLAVAAAGVAEACRRGAALVVLPEMFDLCGPGRVLRAGAEPADGRTAEWSSEMARAHGCWLVAGTSIRRRPDGTRRNTCSVVDPTGAVVARYDKAHLFDVDVPGARYHESAITDRGDRLVVVDVAGVGVGLAVCYDLRFPEVFRSLAGAGAEVVVLPAAFTATTGPPHWEVLVRARAIEDQLYVVAVGQCGASTPELRWHGHSLVVDPWGTVLAEAGSDPTVLVAELRPERVAEVRSQLPSLAARRPALPVEVVGALRRHPGGGAR